MRRPVERAEIKLHTAHDIRAVLSLDTVRARVVIGDLERIVRGERETF